MPLWGYSWPGAFPAYNRFGYYGNGMYPFGSYDGDAGSYNPKPSAAPPPAQAPEPPSDNDAKAEILPPRDALLTLDGQEIIAPADGSALAVGSGQHTLRLSSKAAK